MGGATATRTFPDRSAYNEKDIGVVNNYILSRSLCLPFNPDISNNNILKSSIGVSNNFVQDVSKIASSVEHMLQVMRQLMPLVAPGVAASAAARAAAGSSCATSRVTACAEQTVVAHGTGRSSLC